MSFQLCERAVGSSVALRKEGQVELLGGETPKLIVLSVWAFSLAIASVIPRNMSWSTWAHSAALTLSVQVTPSAMLDRWRGALTTPGPILTRSYNWMGAWSIWAQYRLHPRHRRCHPQEDNLDSLFLARRLGLPRRTLGKVWVC